MSKYRAIGRDRVPRQRLPPTFVANASAAIQVRSLGSVLIAGFGGLLILAPRGIFMSVYVGALPASLCRRLPGIFMPEPCRHRSVGALPAP